ncbi:UvrD-helicase domain-containing protein [Nonomuraea sp. B12E4]|uniref:UvrD-helicase domain-containing protein n=1 Tax=Nonomuraea sp. B12E4 TaxID=3153564 RepID=UPI00325D4BD6
MTYQPTPDQQDVIDAHDPVLLVRGGAGTGKTTTAAAAVRAHLQRHDSAQAHLPRGQRQPARALFLSFSRTAVAQILERSADILGPYRDRVQVTTYHAFAWRLLQQYGTAIGQPDPQLTSPAEARLLPTTVTVQYSDLLPAALDICRVPAVVAHLRTRWSIIVCDEFQDTDQRQFDLLTAIRGGARLLLLCDPNQCIYSSLPGAIGVGRERLKAALALPGAKQITLPEASHRDATGVLPAAATAIRRRDFRHDAITTALSDRRLRIYTSPDLKDEPDQVAAAIDELRAEGHTTIGVFSHHNDATTQLSDELRARDIDHEIIGLSDCLTASLKTQHAMIEFAAGTATWEQVRRELAVFVTSAVRGKHAPPLAQLILGERVQPTGLLAEKLTALREQLAPRAAPIDLAAAAIHAADAHRMLSLSPGQRHWDHAAQLLAPMLTQSLRRVGDRRDTASVLDHLQQAITDRRTALLTNEIDGISAPIQLMGLYQTKGREADATIVVLRQDDFFGYESEPFESGSRLLYVVLTRARHTTIILLLGSPPPLIAPLSALAL